jgi:phosphate acyltransferase
MTEPSIIALDVMGGDHGPSVTVPGAAIAAERHPNVSFLLCGDDAKIAPCLAAAPALAGRATIRHTDQVIAMDAKPSQALRRGRASSMGVALEAVRDGHADFAVSAPC